MYVLDCGGYVNNSNGASSLHLQSCGHRAILAWSS